MSQLTALGQRTRAGFIKKYGAKEGARKFDDAMSKGLIDRSKMENVGLADDDRAEEGDLGTLDPKDMQATPANPSGGGSQPLPKGNVGRGAVGAFQKRPG